MNFNIFHKERSSLKNLLHYQEARKIIPGGAQTISKFPSRFPIGSYPLYIKKAYGNMLVDIDDNKFLDWTSGLGSNILGYNNPAVNKAIREQLEYGINYSYSSELEYRLSKKLTQLIPSAEMVKLFKTGSDSTNAAVRVARAFTKKNKILVSKSCYHGTGDWGAPLMDFHNGVPEGYGNFLDYFEYNNIDSVKKAISVGDIAAIILEPAITEKPNKEFLRELEEICAWNNVLVIYDEMVTGLRSPKFSVQAYINTKPDLSCFGKSLGNGMPISALVGRKDIMELFDVDSAEIPVFYSGTYFGECLSIAAAISTTTELKKRNSFYPKYIGQYLREQAYKENIEGEVARLRLKFRDNLYKSVFLQELAKEGILVGNIIYPNHCHTQKDVDKTALAIVEITKELDSIGDIELRDMLEGQECKDFTLRR